MRDEDRQPGDASKVVHLPNRMPSSEGAAELDERQARRDEIKALLEASIEPLPAPASMPADLVRAPDPVHVVMPSRPDVPPSHHRNAIECPQCDQWTWRATETCLACGFNLFRYFEELAAEKQARLRARQAEYLAELRRKHLYWTAGLLLGGLLLVGNAFRAPTDTWRQWMVYGGFGLFILSALVHHNTPR